MPFLKKFPTSSAGSDSGSGSGSTWSNANNIFATDGAVASSANWGKADSGLIKGSAFGYNLPPNAIIDGIQVDVVGGTFNRIQGLGIVLANGAKSAIKNYVGSYVNTTVGGPTDLWGRTDWLYSDINNAVFSVALSYGLSSSPADAIAQVDSIAVTVYYHLSGSSSPADVETREIYKVYNQQGQYIGLLPVAENLKLTQDINSLGSQITLKVAVNPDTSMLPTEVYTTEDGSDNYTTEDGLSNYTTEGALPIVSAGFQGIDTLIKNGNTVECWLFNYWYPNGKCMYVGKIRRWEGDFGGGDDGVDVVLYSTGYDLDNYMTRGAPFSYTADQQQTSVNAYDTIFTGSKGGGWYRYGQSFKVGAGVTNLGAITIQVNAVADITINVYDQISNQLIGTVTQSVATTGDTNVQFGFPALIPVTPGQMIFFTIATGEGQSAYIIYQNTNLYANGTAYTSSYAGGSGGGSYVPITGDLYFVTGYGTPSTTATFTSQDPSTGMLKPIITDYNLRGGNIVWTATSIDATGLSLTYKFNVQTIYEALQAILQLSPNGFYYYVDLGSQVIYFKNQSTTAEFTVIKGVHIEKLKLINTNENSVNQMLFTGGDVGGGVNLYRQYISQQSINAYGPLLERKTDTRVTLAATADAIGVSTITEFAPEQNQTTITLVHTKRLDLTLLVPGKVIGFRGFGTFVDGLLLQIVHREWTAESVTLTLGTLPTRLSFEYENTTRQLIASQTTNNPGAPS